MGRGRGRPPGPTRARLLAALEGAPWLTGDEAAALAGVAPRQARADLRAGLDDGSLLGHRLAAAPWPPATLHARAPADGSLPAPRRLARAEHTRALHALLVGMAAPGAGHPRAALSGEAGGPPPAGGRHPLAGLADGWLVWPDPARGLLLRWDRGDGDDAAEGRRLEALLALGGDAPPLLVVCAGAAARDEWPQRLPGRAGRPRLWTCQAADLAAGRPAWRDAWGRPDGQPPPGRLRPSWLALPESGAGAPTAADLRRRLRLPPAALAALAALALRPLLTAAQLAWAAGLARRTGHAALALLAAEGLAKAIAAPAGPAALPDAVGASWHATGAGLRLLALTAGLSPAARRATTRLVGGRLARAGDAPGDRRLSGLALAPAHTRELIALEGCFRRSAARLIAEGTPPPALTWRGPVCPAVAYLPPGPDLVVPRWRRAGATPLRGRFYPDARLRLSTDAGRLTCWVEYDRGTRRPARLARKLRHAVGWGAGGAAADARLLVIVPSGAAGREALVHRLVDELAATRRCRRPPLLTTTLDRLLPDRALAAVWWDGTPTAGPPARRALLP